MIDTAQKRRSALSQGGWAHILPLPSGTVDQGAQQDVLWVYRGILAGQFIVPPLVNYVATVADLGQYVATVVG